VPGQPPANVEYSRRKTTHFTHYIIIFGCSESAVEAQKGADYYSLELWDWGCEVTWRGQLQLDNASFQANHRRLRSVAGAQFGEHVLNSPLDGLLCDRELIGDLLIGISGCDQP